MDEQRLTASFRQFDRENRPDKLTVDDLAFQRALREYYAAGFKEGMEQGEQRAKAKASSLKAKLERLLGVLTRELREI